MKEIDASTFFSALDCMTQGWHLRREVPDDDRRSDSEIFESRQRSRVRRLARDLYPEAVDVEGETPRARSRDTRERMKKRSTRMLFGATFLVDGHVARADVLVRVPGGWKLVLFSTSLDRPKLSRDKVEPVAYAWMIASRAKVRIKSAARVFMRRTFRLSMDVDQLFIERDVTERAKKLVAEWREHVPAVRRRTGGKRPKPTRVPACNSCPYFGTECLGVDVAHPVTDLPNLRGKIVDLPAIDIEELPDDLGGVRLNPVQRRVIEAVRTDEEHVGPEVAEALARIRRPTYYLDFETTATEIPLYPGVAPHEVVPTQFSLHRARPSGELVHTEFLADPERDCRRELAEQLLHDVGKRGSIVVYSGYEENVLEGLAELFPDLADPLAAVIERLFDLWAEIIKPGHYYHPDFHGSSSIKYVLPVLAPDLSYDGMTIADGQGAKVAFARLALGEYSEREAERMRADLLEYCRLDSLAMRRIHEALIAITKGAGS